MSIASLFKPVDSSKTRLPRTDVLERVAQYADGGSVISNYFDISTPELVKMLENNLVPAPDVEYVTNIVRSRQSGETGAAPKTSVGEAIKTTPIKKFTVSDPTKDFITLEDIIGKPTFPSGFERGNYLESLIGSGTTGGPTQRGTPAKGESVDPRVFTKRPIDPYIESGQTAGMSYTPQTPSEPVYSLPPPAPSPSATPTTDYRSTVSARPKEDRVARGLDSLQSLKDSRTASIMAENLGGADAIKLDQVKSINKPEEGTTATSEIASMLRPDPRNLENTGLIDTLKRYLGPTPVQQVVSQTQQEITNAEKAARRAEPTQRLRPPVSPVIEPPVKQGTSFTEFLYGRPEAKRMEEEANATAAGDVTTARMAPREAGITTLPSSTGAATDQSGGIVPRGVDPTGIGRDSTPTPAFVAGTDPTRVTSQPSATPAVTAPVTPDKPTKEDKKAIQETATEVAKNPSVGGIQSLFEQAGFSDALLQLGLGMMASKNPSFLGALGESGQSAVALMAKQREEAKKAKLEADKFELEKQRNIIYGKSVDQAGTTDKRPAIVQTSEAYSKAINEAKKQAEAGQYGTTEQFIASDYASNKLVPAAQEAAQKAATAWEKAYQDMSPSKRKEYEEKNPKDAYVNKAYQDTLQRNPTLYNLLNIGVPPAQNKVYDPVSKTLK